MQENIFYVLVKRDTTGNVILYFGHLIKVYQLLYYKHCTYLCISEAYGNVFPLYNITLCILNYHVITKRLMDSMYLYVCKYV